MQGWFIVTFTEIKVMWNSLIVYFSGNILIINWRLNCNVIFSKNNRIKILIKNKGIKNNSTLRFNEVWQIDLLRF